MSDPSRLCQDASSDGFERALLRSASLDREPEDGAARALAALGLATAAVGAGAAGTAATTTHAASATGAGLVTKMVAGVVTAIVFAGAIVAIARPQEDASTPLVASAPPSIVEPVSTLETAPLAAPEPRVVAVADLPPAPSVTAKAPASRAERARRAPAVPSTPAAPMASISDELALIDQARASIRAGETTRAEQVLDTYDARFDRGALVVEAKLARIELHLARGEDALARALGERFLAEHPQTAYERRIRALLRRARTEPTIVQ